MKIGELFIALGFQVKGRQEFDDAQRSLKGAAVDAGKLALVINAVNVALLGLMATGTRVAVGLKNFTLQTGLSRDELQKWQHQAQVNDVTGQELASTIVGLQDVRASFALGEPKDVGAWALLGVDPRQDPFVVLDQLGKKLRAIEDVGVARNLAERVGINANVFQMLRASNDEFSKWRKQFEVTKQQEDRLIRLNRAWKDLLYNLTAIRVQFASALAPALETLSKVLGWVTTQVAKFNAWLNSSAIVGKAFRFILGAIAVAFLVVGAGIAVVTVALAALSAVMALLSPSFVALLPLIAEAAVFFGVLLAVLVALVLVVDEIITSLTGGKSVLRDFGESIGEWLSQFEAVQHVMEVIDSLLQKLQKGWEKFGPSKLAENFFRQFQDDESSFRGINERNRGEAWFAPRTPRVGAATVNQTVNVDVAVDGARSPEATGKAVGRSVREEVNAAAYQMPVPNL
jgi:hypothetical protein